MSSGLLVTPQCFCESALSCPALMSALKTIIWVYLLVCVSLFLPAVCTVTDRFQKRLIEYSGAGHVRGAGHGRNGDNENIWRLLWKRMLKIKIWHEISMKTWTHDSNTHRLWCSNVIKKEASKKRIAAWGEAAYANKLKPVLWHFLWY